MDLCTLHIYTTFFRGVLCIRNTSRSHTHALKVARTPFPLLQYEFCRDAALFLYVHAQKDIKLGLWFQFPDCMGEVVRSTLTVTVGLTFTIGFLPPMKPLDCWLPGEPQKDPCLSQCQNYLCV